MKFERFDKFCIKRGEDSLRPEEKENPPSKEELKKRGFRETLAMGAVAVIAAVSIGYLSSENTEQITETKQKFQKLVEDCIDSIDKTKEATRREPTLGVHVTEDPDSPVVNLDPSDPESALTYCEDLAVSRMKKDQYQNP